MATHDSSSGKTCPAVVPPEESPLTPNDNDLALKTTSSITATTHSQAPSSASNVDPQQLAPIPVPPTVPSSGITIQAHKLWLGNLDKRLTQQNILKFVSPFGTVVSFKYLLHTSGIEKGEPRGYCFVEYSTREEAERAKGSLHGRLALGRKITVDWARPDMSARKTGTLVSETWDPSSVSATLQGDASTKAKIAAIEAKLRQMEEGKPHPTIQQQQQKRNANIVGHIYTTAPRSAAEKFTRKHGGHNLKMHRANKPYNRIEIRTRK